MVASPGPKIIGTTTDYNSHIEFWYGISPYHGDGKNWDVASAVAGAIEKVKYSYEFSKQDWRTIDSLPVIRDLVNEHGSGLGKIFYLAWYGFAPKEITRTVVPDDSIEPPGPQ